MINIFKVVEGEIGKKEFKQKTLSRQIFTQTKDKYKKETYLDLEIYDTRAANTKLGLSSHCFLTNTAKCYKLSDDQKICTHDLKKTYLFCLTVLFEFFCYNYYTDSMYPKR